MIPLHPKIVHFPVALLISAAIMGILALVWKSNRDTLREVLFWNLVLGVAGGILALISGLIEETNLVHNEAIHAILEIHKSLGFVIAGVFTAALIWLIVRKSKMKAAEFAALVSVLVISAGLVVYSAYLGGKMVYEEGAGVVPMEEVISSDKQDQKQDQNQEHDHGSHEH